MHNEPLITAGQLKYVHRLHVCIPLLIVPPQPLHATIFANEYRDDLQNIMMINMILMSAINWFLHWYLICYSDAHCHIYEWNAPDIYAHACEAQNQSSCALMKFTKFRTNSAINCIVIPPSLSSSAMLERPVGQISKHKQRRCLPRQENQNTQASLHVYKKRALCLPIWI